MDESNETICGDASDDGFVIASQHFLAPLKTWSAVLGHKFFVDANIEAGAIVVRIVLAGVAFDLFWRRYLSDRTTWFGCGNRWTGVVCWLSGCLSLR